MPGLFTVSFGSATIRAGDGGNRVGAEISSGERRSAFVATPQDLLGLVLDRLRTRNDPRNVGVFVPRLPGRGILAVQFPLLPFEGLAALPVLPRLFLVALCEGRSHRISPWR